MAYRLEPLVTEEQGVVYLFSKYQKKISLFDKIDIYKVGTRFPDVIYRSRKSFNGIEFEGKLSKIRTHYPNKYYKKIKINQFTHKEIGFLNTKRIDARLPFYILYWFKDVDEELIRKEILFSCKKKFSLEIIPLSRYFTPFVEKNLKDGKIKAGLIFQYNKIRLRKEAYKLSVIKAKLEKIKKFIEPINGEKVIRCIGHNLKNTEDLTLSHWAQIHFYTTHSDIKKCDLEYLLLNNNEEGILILKVYKFFRFKEKSNKKIKNFFEEFYFERLEPWDDYRDPNCIVFSESKLITSKKDLATIREYFDNLHQSRGGIIEERDSRYENFKTLLDKKINSKIQIKNVS